MKREIEFRGQKADNKEWVYGYLVCIPDGDSFDCYIISDFDERDSIYDLWKYAIKVIPETVGQYVGIKEKNGKKVYAGDIVYNSYYNCEVVFGLYGVDDYKTVGFFMKANNALFIDEEDDFVYFGFDEDYDKIEVIGNIYDTTELLYKI